MDYIFYFLVTIGILVFIHEFGHFAAAKLTGMRAEVFAIGFGKRLFGWNKINGFTFGKLPEDLDLGNHTDYRISLLPLGGYVKVAGMVDESMDTDNMASEPQPWEFRASTTPRKILVLIAGVLMNLLLTISIFWGMNFFQGKQVIKTTQLGNVQRGGEIYQLGFRSQDQIVSVNGTKMENWEDVLSSLLLTQAVELKINIDREERNINLVVESDKLLKLSFLPMAFSRPLVTSVMENSPAKDAGLQDGDVLVNIDKTEVLTAKDVIAIVTKNKAKQIPIVAVRDADTMNFVVKTSVDGLIGIGLGEIYTGEVYYKTYGFFDSITQSFVNISDYTKDTFTALGQVIQGEIAIESAFGGPVKIAKFAAKSAENGFSTFLYFLAALSLSLAIINIFPFPGLDGGHLVIVVIEAIIRRELPLKAKIVIQNIGFFALLALMAYIIYIDIISM